MVTENKQMQVRRGTSSAWSSANPVNLDGEIGYDKTLNKLKVGDGTTAWNTLPFLGGGIIVSRGAFASRPGSGTNVGDIYNCTDIGNQYRWSGSAWEMTRGGDLTVFTPPPSTGWTALGGATVTAALDSRITSTVGATGNSWKGEYRTLSPTSNYTATFYFDWIHPGAFNVYGGIVLRQSSDGKLVTFNTRMSGAAPWTLAASTWTSATGTGTNYTTVSLTSLTNGLPNWLRIRDDGTTRFFEYSYNGVDWQEIWDVVRTDFMIPDQIGWGNNVTISGSTATTRLRHFSGVA